VRGFAVQAELSLVLLWFLFGVGSVGDIGEGSRHHEDNSHQEDVICELLFFNNFSNFSEAYES
jgi:hypothetical protein